MSPPSSPSPPSPAPAPPSALAALSFAPSSPPTTSLACPPNLSRSSTPSSASSYTPPPLLPTRKPFFFPPLWLQRRTACVQALRRHQVHSVADLGCGPGAVLQLLAMPADALDDFPGLYPPSPVPASPADSVPDVPVAGPSGAGARAKPTRQGKLEVLRRVPRCEPEQNELHLRRLVGMDISADALANAAGVVAPVESVADRRGSGAGWVREESERWEELRVELYEGGLELHNPGLEGIDGMIATEVIEHMTPAAFAKFPRVVLGAYRPKVLVITTPNHEFNPWFVSSSKEEESRNRFPDPSGRTPRVFRDDDHEFEMTRDEFQAWATVVAEEHAYDVAFSGVGSLEAYYGGLEHIPSVPPSLAAHPTMAEHPSSLAVPSEPYKFHATQVATFVRRDPCEPERSPRSHHTSPLPFYSPPTLTSRPSNGSVVSPPLNPRKSVPNKPHKLLHSFVHPPHSTANQPVPAAEILAAFRRVMGGDSGPLVAPAEGGGGQVALGDLWRVGEVRRLCGGLKAALVDAVVEEEGGEWDLRVDLTDGKVAEAALLVVWRGWVAPPEPVWESEDASEEEEVGVQHVRAEGRYGAEWRTASPTNGEGGRGEERVVSEWSAPAAPEGPSQAGAAGGEWDDW